MTYTEKQRVKLFLQQALAWNDSQVKVCHSEQKNWVPWLKLPNSKGTVLPQNGEHFQGNAKKADINKCSSQLITF